MLWDDLEGWNGRGEEAPGGGKICIIVADACLWQKPAQHSNFLLH